MEEMIKKGTKVTILGAGNVGASIAYTLAVAGTCSEIILVDINKAKAEGEAMDIRQGLAFCPSVSIRAGEYEDAVDSDIVVVTLGIARKPGQTRIDLAQTNVNIIKQVMPIVANVAPNAVYVTVSNPVDILTYAIIKSTNIPPSQIIGSGTMLDSSRLRATLADHVGLNIKNIHAYVFGEHGDSAMIPWSLTAMAGMEMNDYCSVVCKDETKCAKEQLLAIENDVKTAGAEVIKRKGATYYAIALSVNKICDVILRNSGEALTVSSLVNNHYGINDVCLSLPCIIGGHGIISEITPKLLPEEEKQLQASANSLKEVISTLNF